MISEYIKNIKNIAWPDKHIVDDIYKINISRVFYLSVISVVARFLQIITLLNQSSVEHQSEKIWRTGLLVSHFTYLVLLLIICILAYKHKKKDKPNFVTIVTQCLAIVFILLYGIIITSIDQLVTPSITPFIIACISISAIFITKPVYTLLMFLSGYVVYYFAIGIIQPEASIVLSNRINGFTSIFLGIFLSFVLWKSNVVNLQQKEHILFQQKELENKNKELEHLATHDSLTGLVNRRHFEEKVSHEMARIKRHGGNSCLLLLDIDNFKEINDKYGHPIGDKVLQNLAALLKAQLRETDTASRFGGEEFAIILINADARAGKIVAEKLRSVIEKEIFIIDNQEINITASIGISAIDNSINSYEEVYKYADKALYICKGKGKKHGVYRIKKIRPPEEFARIIGNQIYLIINSLI